MKKTLALLLLLAGLTVEAQGRTLYWTGAENDVWDIKSENWVDADGKGASFAEGDIVVFGDTESVVALSGNLKPSLVQLEGTGFFTSSLEGHLTGSMQLVKSGDGLFSIFNANDYTGDTLLTGGILNLGNDKALGSGKVVLSDNTTLRFYDYSLSNNVSVEGCATMIGTMLNGDVAVGGGYTLILGSDLQGDGCILLGESSTLNLGEYTLSNNVSVEGCATIVNGTVKGDLQVLPDKELILGSDLQVDGSFLLEDNATLNLGEHTLSGSVTVNGSTANIGNGTVKGDLSIVSDNTLLALNGDLQVDGSFLLEDNATLNLGEHTLSGSVQVYGSTANIGNGTVKGDLSIVSDNTLALNGDLQVDGRFLLGDNTTLNLGEHTLSGCVTVNGSTANIGNGTVKGDLTLRSKNTLALNGDLQVDGSIILWEYATLNLGEHTFSGNISLKEFNATIKAGKTSIEAMAPGMLKELTVSESLIAGTNRQASLADGLEIQSEANLMIKGMTITAQNIISVGQNTITLNQVTIDLSKAEYKLVDSNYYFQLRGLINCDLEMDDVVFDASGLELPTGFDPAVNGIGIDFGTDVTIDPQTAKNLTLLMGDHWSQTVSLGDGKPVFTALVPTPEPTTGTLSLLALAGLAARRRRK